MSASKILNGLVQSGRTAKLGMMSINGYPLGLVSGCITSIAAKDRSSLAYVIPKDLQSTQTLRFLRDDGTIVKKELTRNFYYFKLGTNYSPTPLDDQEITPEQKKIADRLQSHNISITKTEGLNHPNYIINVDGASGFYGMVRFLFRSAAAAEGKNITNLVLPEEVCQHFNITPQVAATEIARAAASHTERHPNLPLLGIALAIGGKNTEEELDAFKKSFSEHVAAKASPQADEKSFTEELIAMSSPFEDQSYTLGEAEAKKLPFASSLINPKSQIG